MHYRLIDREWWFAWYPVKAWATLGYRVVWLRWVKRSGHMVNGVFVRKWHEDVAA